VHVSFSSTVEMDRFHCRNLNSPSSTRVVGAYLSVVYWGHYSGAAGIVRAARALSKVNMAKAHTTYGNSFGILKTAKSQLKRGHIAQAILLLTGLSQVGFAFASKLCAFIAPDICGVIDSVIVGAFPAFGFELDAAGYVKNSPENARRYEVYCRVLQRKAKGFNSLGVRFRWRDNTGRAWRWRAVDVERAMYG
jgi:hypothetical protein